MTTGNIHPLTESTIIMKIALLGYGRMGKTIEEIALAAGDEVVLRIDTQNVADLTSENLQAADVAIDFSIPTVAFSHIERCLKAGCPVVSGTTAWLDRFEEAKALCLQEQGALFYASNFSIGVNLFFAINRYAAKLLGGQAQYKAELEEIHHIHKLDAPSGTAISLAEDLLAAHPGYTSWSLVESDAQAEARVLPIVAKRIGETPGTHSIQYSSEEDELLLTHRAQGRIGFAKGALAAARWLCSSPKIGVFGMADMLQLEKLG